jgi:hypothetical protein
MTKVDNLKLLNLNFLRQLVSPPYADLKLGDVYVNHLHCGNGVRKYICTETLY